MIDAALARVPVKARTDTALILLILAGAAVAFLGGLLAHAPSITRTVHVTRPEPITDVASLERALGKPDGQTQEGCPGWQLGSAVVVVCTP